MGVVLDAVRRFVEKRSLDVKNQNHWILGLLNQMQTKAGVSVGPDSALQVSAVFACVRVISETIASLPLKVYERSADGGKNIVTGHPVVDLIRKPNTYQTTFEFFETITGHLNLRGNAFCGKSFNGYGQIAELIPLDPSCMEVEVSNTGAITYRYTPPDGRTINYSQERIWHPKGLSSDGIQGLSPIALCREAIGLAAAAETHGSVFFRDGSRSPGIVKIPGRLKEDAQKRVAETLKTAMTGENRFKLVVFEDGLDWVNTGISNEDSQFLETRQFQVQEIARIFRVPCVLIGHPDNTSTYASAEQFFLSFVTHCVRPWCERLEQSFNRYIIPENEQDRIFVEFSVDGLLRGDIASRFNAYATGRQWGFLSVNDIRKLENLNPVANGDIYLQPVNMVEAGTKPEPAPEPQPFDEGGDSNAE